MSNLVCLLVVKEVLGVAMLVAVKGRTVQGLQRLLVVEVGAAMEVEVEVVVVWRLKQVQLLPLLFYSLLSA